MVSNLFIQKFNLRFLIFVLSFSPIFNILCQERCDGALFDYVYESSITFSGDEAMKLENFKVNPLYEQVLTVKYKKMQNFEINGDVTICIPNFIDEFTVTRTSLEANSEDEFTWVGDIIDGRGNMIIVAKANGIS